VIAHAVALTLGIAPAAVVEVHAARVLLLLFFFLFLLLLLLFFLILLSRGGIPIRSRCIDLLGIRVGLSMEIHESIAKGRKKGILRGFAQYFLRKMLPSYSGCGRGSGNGSGSSSSTASAAQQQQQQQH
jgi:hypothetical protein